MIGLPSNMFMSHEKLTSGTALLLNTLVWKVFNKAAQQSAHFSWITSWRLQKSVQYCYINWPCMGEQVLPRKTTRAVPNEIYMEVMTTRII